jgi:antirestriction protein ArdC
MSEKIYQMVTDRILSLLEQGTIPWNRPWSGSASKEHPMNLESQREYRGMNVFLLSAMGFSSRYWLSFKQAKERGGHVRKGERSTPVIFWKRLAVADKETGDPKEIPMIRYYSVFNLDQIEGIKPPDALEPVVNEFNPIERAEAIIAGMPNPPMIIHSEPRAYYRPAADTVNLPKPELFAKPEHYYSTAFHELAHSTGHETRLKRRPSAVLRFFGDKEYSREELVAEMGAAFLSAEAGIEQAVIENQAAYLQSWISVLKGSPKLVVQAASAAQAAADFILNRQSTKEVECGNPLSKT